MSGGYATTSSGRERIQQRAQMEHLAAAVEVRQVEREHLDAGQEAAERLDPGGVRAVRVADEQRPLVEPDGVAALRELVALEPAEDGQRQVGASASGSPRRPAFPGWSRIAPCGVTSTGS